MRAPWVTRSDAVLELLRGALRNERDEVAAFRRQLSIVEARNAAALSFVRDKHHEILTKVPIDITGEDAAVSSFLLTVEYLLTSDGAQT